MININEDDVISRAETPKDYKLRLLRKINDNDISGFDTHDRVHGALAFVENIQQHYPGFKVSILVRHFLKGGTQHANALVVHGISPDGKSLRGLPIGSSSHKHEELVKIKNVSGLHVARYPNLSVSHREVLARLMDFRGIREVVSTFKTMILERRNTPNNKSLWTKAQAIAKKKFNVNPSAYYANEWAERWYKKHGGNWSKTNEGTENMTPREKDKQKYIIEYIAKAIILDRLNEEIVNPENAGTMTKGEIRRRDKNAKKGAPANIKPINGDTEEEMKHRFYTFVELKKRKKEKGKSVRRGKRKKK